MRNLCAEHPTAHVERAPESPTGPTHAARARQPVIRGEMSRSHDGPISTRERLSDTLTDLPTAPLPPPKRVRVSTLQDAETRRLREQEWVAAVERAEASARARSSVGSRSLRPAFAAR